LRYLYAVGVLGSLLQISGGQWDVSSHALGIVESFFTLPHAILYLGILFVLLASLAGLRLASKSKESSHRRLFTGIKIATAGTAIQLVAAPIDFWWHSNFGFDPYLFTPAHSLLIVGLALGGTGMMLGSTRLLSSSYENRSLQVLGVASLAVFWLDMYFIGTLLTNLQGIAYTFRICSPELIVAQNCAFVKQNGNLGFVAAVVLYATAGTFAFFKSRRVLVKPSRVYLVALIVASIYASMAMGTFAFIILYLNPPGSFYIRNPSIGLGLGAVTFIPIYLLLSLPVLPFILLGRRAVSKTAALALSVLFGPLASILDGRFASILWLGGDFIVVPFVILFGLVGGLLGGLLGIRLTGTSPPKP